jgi:threonine/homoserine/homoserine lactone efflux protein
LPRRTAAYKRELRDRFLQSLASTLCAAFVIWLVASLTGFTHSTHAQVARILGLVIVLVVLLVVTVRMDMTEQRAGRPPHRRSAMFWVLTVAGFVVVQVLVQIVFHP